MPPDMVQGAKGEQPMIVDMDFPGGIINLEQGETLEMIPQPERAVCDYCASYSKTDMRGNCICCGAPKQPSGRMPMFVRTLEGCQPTREERWLEELQVWRIK